jgi:small-conductance mechanosensitive channel
MKISEFLSQDILSFGERSKIEVGDVVMAVVIILATILIIRWIKRLLMLATRKNKINVGQQYAIYQLAKYFIIVISFILVLEAFHVRPTVLLTGSAALLVGIGLGLQQLANDIISGFILLIEPSIRVNDIVEVDGIVAKVKEIGIRTSQIETREGVFMIIPNHLLVSEKVTNWTTNKTITRFKISVGVAYGSDVKKVRQILMECAERHNEVRKNPKPMVRFTEFGDSSLNFDMLFWSRAMFNIEDIQSDLRFMINEEFAKNNVVIPFPQRDLHLKSGPFGPIIEEESTNE